MSHIERKTEMITQAFKRIRTALYRGALAYVDFGDAETRTLGQPIPVDYLVSRPLPAGWYRLRNGERVRVESTGDELVRAYGCSLPSALPLRWSGNGRYAPSGNDHVLDLVEFEGPPL